MTTASWQVHWLVPQVSFLLFWSSCTAFPPSLNKFWTRIRTLLLMRSMFMYTQVTNAINVQPKVLDDINIVIFQFLKIFHTMHERCMTSLQVISAIFFHILYLLNRTFKAHPIYWASFLNCCLYALVWRNHICWYGGTSHINPHTVLLSH
jgi:hypothetical protein